MSEKIVDLEKSFRLSKSLLWKYQQDYFERQGVNAWAQNQVPYYVTSNVLIAQNYAQMFCRYLQDSIRNGKIDLAAPLYIFELGTGSGKFSYLFLKKFVALLKHFKINIKLRYVMTDFTNNNVSYWMEHPQFQEFLEEGILDFAIYRIGEKQEIKLIKSGLTLKEGSCKNPVMIVSNYIFDTVPHDLFKVTSGKLFEGLISIRTPEDNVTGDSVVELKKIQADFTYREISLPYYNEPFLDNILEEYRNQLIDSIFLVPISAIVCLDNFRGLSNNRMFMVSADNGYTSIDSMKHLSEPYIAHHGSFSMSVNFDFMGRYVKQCGGDNLLAEEHEGIKISLLCIGDTFDNLPETTVAYEEFNNRISTKEFLDIKNQIIKHLPELELQHLMSLLKFSYWDTDIFMSIVSRLVEIINRASPSYINSLRHGLEELSDNYYFLKNLKNVPGELGRVYQLIGELDKAILFYKKAVDCFGEESAISFNLGICYYYKNLLPQALDSFEKAYKLNSGNKQAKEWIKHVKKDMKSKGKS